MREALAALDTILAADEVQVEASNAVPGQTVLVSDVPSLLPSPQPRKVLVLVKPEYLEQVRATVAQLRIEAGREREVTILGGQPPRGRA